MFEEDKICFKQALLVCSVALLSVNIRACSFSSTKNLDFIFKICHDTLKLSDSPLLYIWNWNQNFPMFPLIRLLHENLISTILIDHHTFLKDSVNQKRVKNILIVLNDCEDIRILIRDFADDENTKNTTVLNTSILHYEVPLSGYPEKGKDNGSGLAGYRPINYRNDCHDCHYSMNNNKSVLDTANSRESIHRVRSLFISRIFNGENNLIFYVYKKDANNASGILTNLQYKLPKSRPETFLTEKSLTCDVRLIFKFMWQTFRGFGVLICPGERICYNYNPFSENIMQHTGEKSAYFGNSIFSMENKSLSVLYVVKDYDFPLEFKLQQAIFRTLFMRYFAKHFNCSLNYTLFSTEKQMSEEVELRSAIVSKGLNLNVDLIVFDAGVRVSEPWHYDYSVALDTSSLMFFVPRSGYWPQYLIVFKSFTPSVWMMILFASAFSISIHHLFRRLALKSIRSLFTETELMSYERFSPIWSVYCYFVCVSQQTRLLFVHLLSGKLLFFTMAFSLLTLATLLQSEMITLVSKRVRCFDIDTIEDLEGSDLQIQSVDLEGDRGLFGTDLNYRSIKKRLTDNYVFLGKVINEIDNLAFRLFNDSSDPIKAMSENNKLIAELVEKVQERQTQIIQTDAFLCLVPFQIHQSLRDILLKLRSYPDDTESPEEHEQHFVHERVMSFPFSYAFPKYSFFAKQFSDYILRLADNGHIVNVLDQELYSSEQTIRLIVETLFTDKEVKEVRPFSIADLGSGFMILTCGLLSSCAVFIIELLFSCV